MRCWREFAACLLLVFCAAGCQCCPLTDHYASAVDCIADHEHGLDALYSPCHDLTRIGRPDWCHCGINRWLCKCRCERCKPLPHIIDTTAAAYVGMNCPWAEGGAPRSAVIPDDAHNYDGSIEQLDADPDDRGEELLDRESGPNPSLEDAAGFPPGEESLDLTPEEATDETSFSPQAPAAELWALDR